MTRSNLAPLEKRVNAAKLMAVLWRIRPHIRGLLRQLISDLRRESYESIRKSRKAEAAAALKRTGLCILAVSLRQPELLLDRQVPRAKWVRRAQEVVKMRFGLEDGSEHTLEEVGQAFAVTRERIRQIEAKALRKLRHPSRSRKLRAFLDDVHE